MEGGMSFKFLRNKKPNLPSSYFERLEKAEGEAHEKVLKIRDDYNRNLINHHEGLASLQIEMALLQEAVRKNPKRHDHEAIRNNLRNIAALSLRFMTELT
jgi:hypothetical protein